MSGRNRFGGELYRTASLLSQRVSKADPFFGEIALMGIEDRVRYALLKTIRDQKILDMDLDAMSVEDLIDKVILPLVQRKGQAQFKADPLTHLGMKVGEPTEATEYEI